MIVLGIDYGRKKIGIAFGDTETGLVEPLRTVFSRQSASLRSGVWGRSSVGSILRRLIEEREVKLVVIGITGGKIDEEINNFGKKIKKEIGLPVDFYDETLTTRDAAKIMGQVRRTKNYKKSMEDAIAAAVMLQSYLEREEKNV